MRKILLVICLLSFGLNIPAVAEEPSPRPKYGPHAVRLYHAREHLQQQPAPDYWALAPYYTAQPTNAACSLATVAMLMNGLRADAPLAADQPLVTPRHLLETMKQTSWPNAVAQDGDGVSLDELAEIVRDCLKAYCIPNMRVDAIHIDNNSPAELDKLKELLRRNEQSDRDFLVINFLQSEFTGDPEGNVGHFAPIAAFDEERNRVLVLDPDREWYEPYWVNVPTLMKGLATTDPQSKRSRGYLWIHEKPAAGD